MSFRAQQLRNANPDILRIRLGQVKGLSRSFNAAAGEMTVNLRSGAFEVRLQSSDVFNASRPESAQFDFDSTQTEQIADFMRGINTLQNIDIARRELAEVIAINDNRQREVSTRLQTAFDETQDAIEVLEKGGIFPSAVERLTTAQQRIAQAQHTNNASQRRVLAQQAITELVAARDAVATVAP